VEVSVNFFVILALCISKKVKREGQQTDKNHQADVYFDFFGG